MGCVNGECNGVECECDASPNPTVGCVNGECNGIECGEVASPAASTDFKSWKESVKVEVCFSEEKTLERG